MITRVSSKGQIVSPAEFRQKDVVEPGQQFHVERTGRAKYRLTRIEPASNEGIVDWLLACPAKGYFVPIQSESTGAV